MTKVKPENLFSVFYGIVTAESQGHFASVYTYTSTHAPTLTIP